MEFQLLWIKCATTFQSVLLTVCLYLQFAISWLSTNVDTAIAHIKLLYPIYISVQFVCALSPIISICWFTCKWSLILLWKNSSVLHFCFFSFGRLINLYLKTRFIFWGHLNLFITIKLYYIITVYYWIDYLQNYLTLVISYFPVYKYY